MRFYAAGFSSPGRTGKAPSRQLRAWNGNVSQTKTYYPQHVQYHEVPRLLLNSNAADNNVQKSRKGAAPLRAQRGLSVLEATHYFGYFGATINMSSLEAAPARLAVGSSSMLQAATRRSAPPDMARLRPLRPVQFSESSQLLIYDCPGDARQRWYTTEDRSLFRQELIRDARTQGRLLGTQRPEDVSQDDIFKCVGIENLLSLERTVRVMEHRQQHLQLVLAAQRSGYSRNAIARLCQESSTPSQVKAHTLASGYMKMLHTS